MYPAEIGFGGYLSPNSALTVQSRSGPGLRVAWLNVYQSLLAFDSTEKPLVTDVVPLSYCW